MAYGVSNSHVRTTDDVQGNPANIFETVCLCLTIWYPTLRYYDM